jgi:hypothetical protein
MMASVETPNTQAVSDPATQTRCNLLIIGDSHCRDLNDVIARAYPNIKVYIISVGQQTDSIINCYISELNAVTAFMPDVIVLHTGHNEIAYHRHKNPIPKDSTLTTAITINAAQIIQSHHPRATMIISSIFPRLLTFKSSLRQQDLAHYNRTAERHGRRLHTEATKIGILVFKNNFMWKSKSDMLVKSHLYLQDGLHLNDKARIYVIARWMNEIHTILLNK